MKEVIDFVENFLQHEYDPVKAREYYLRTRELKGRKAAVGKTTINPKSKLSFAGGPLNKLGTLMLEDQTPITSPSGAGLSTFDSGPHGLGRAVYKDGSTYDAKTGWSGVKKSPVSKKRRVAQAEQKLKRARQLANGIKNQQRRQQVLQRLKNAERKLETTQKKYGNTQAVTRRRSGV